MGKLFGLTVMAGLVAASAGAQERTYVTTTAGVATTHESTSGIVNVDYGVAVRKNIIVFGGLGRLQNVEPSVAQAAVDTTVSTLAASSVAVTGQARVPAWYADGGVRLLLPNRSRIVPYVSGALGYGRTTPSGRFVYDGTTTIAGTTTTSGADATDDVKLAGDFTAPAASSGIVLRFGAGAQIPIKGSLAATAGYDFTHLGTSTAINAGSFVFGVGLRF